MSKNNFSICDFRKINVSKLEYSSPKTIQGGNQASYIYYRESHNKLTSLFIRIPKMRTSSGICRKSSHYYIDLELDLNNEHSDFFDFLIKIDKNNRLITFQNSIEWFNDQIPQDTIEDYYIPSIKLNAGGKNSTFNIRIPVKGNTLIPQIYNNNTIVDHSYVSPHDFVDCIISLAEIRYSSEKFYPIWNLIQLRINKQITSPYPIENILIEDDDAKLERDNSIKESERLEELRKLEKKRQEEEDKQKKIKEQEEQEEIEKQRKLKEEQEELEKQRKLKEQEELEKQRKLKEEQEEQEENTRNKKDKHKNEKDVIENFKKNLNNKKNNIKNDDINNLMINNIIDIDNILIENEKEIDIINVEDDLENIKRKQKLNKLERERIEREKLNKILEEEQLEKTKLKERLEHERLLKEKLMLKKQDHDGIFKEKMEREKLRQKLEEERLEKEHILQKIEEERLETERLRKLVEEEEKILEQERLEEEARLLEEERLKEIERQKEEENRLEEEKRIKIEKEKKKKLEKLRKIQLEMEELENDIVTNSQKPIDKFYSVDPDIEEELNVNDFEELSFG